MSKTLQDVFNTFIDCIDELENGCWQWNKSLAYHGYGIVHLDYSGRMPAHRFSHMVFKGDIPNGYHTDHLCRNRGCVNPDHLEAVTPRENICRGESPTAINSRKTHCKNGHPYTDTDNIKICRFGGRITRRCLICTRKYAREYYYKRKLQNGQN